MNIPYLIPVLITKCKWIHSVFLFFSVICLFAEIILRSQGHFKVKVSETQTRPPSFLYRMRVSSETPTNVNVNQFYGRLSPIQVAVVPRWFLSESVDCWLFPAAPWAAHVQQWDFSGAWIESVLGTLVLRSKATHILTSLGWNSVMKYYGLSKLLADIERYWCRLICSPISANIKTVF